MPLVFSPPPRRSRARDARPASGSSRLPHSVRPAARIGALAGVAALLLSGCTSEPEEHTLATPTAAGPTETEAAEPEYTTDLQLSEEEKKAVEEAVPKLDEYIDLLNEVYSAGGDGVEKFDDVARDQVLFAAKDEVNQMQDRGVRMVGEYRLESRHIETVDLKIDDDTQIPFVTIHSCIPRDEFSFEGMSTNENESEQEPVSTYQFVIAKYDDSWFVSEHDLWDHGCES